MLISAHAAATSLSSYYTFKEQLKPAKKNAGAPPLSFSNLNSYSKRYRLKGLMMAAAQQSGASQLGGTAVSKSKKRTLSQEEERKAFSS